MNKKLFEIATKVATPISLASMAVMALYLVYRAILALNIFSALEQERAFMLISAVADKLFYLAILALILGGGSYLYAQYLGARPEQTDKDLAITGNVLFASGKPVEGARVFVEGVDRQKETDATGWFKIEVGVQKSWTVRALYGDKAAEAVVRRKDVQKPVRLTLPDDAELENKTAPELAEASTGGNALQVVQNIRTDGGDYVGGKKVIHGDVIRDDAQKITIFDQRTQHVGQQSGDAGRDRAGEIGGGPRADLERNIRKAYKFIRQYEAARLDTNRPEEKSRAERKIAEQWEYIRAQLADYLPRYGVDVPRDIRGIAEYCGLA